MSLLAADILDAVARELHDSRANSSVERTWGDAELLAFLNNAIRQIAVVRPDMTSKIATVRLAPGALQRLPEDGLRLLTIIRNRGRDGTADGKAITLSERALLDATSPYWTSVRSTIVANYVYDIRFGSMYYVYPGASDTLPVWVEIVYSAAPRIAAMTDTLPVPDICAVPLKHWVKFECLAPERFDDASPAEAKGYYERFYNELGLKTTTDGALPVN